MRFAEWLEKKDKIYKAIDLDSKDVKYIVASTTEIAARVADRMLRWERVSLESMEKPLKGMPGIIEPSIPLHKVIFAKERVGGKEYMRYINQHN